MTSRVLPASVLGLAALTGLGGSLLASNPVVPHPGAPPGTGAEAHVSVPDSAIEMPASVSRASYTAIGAQAKVRTVAATSARSVPPAALGAYQRAASVINASDPGCHLDWELLAAIGRVESDHGRHGASSLDADGVARPAIIGIALDGHRTQRIEDTDAGQFDNDRVHDRAVGPLQFIPSTWAMVGVDADGDGMRNPQDIDDAALAAAVYLCSGSDDLATESGRRSAVFRYNHSESYVGVVLDLMEKYVDGQFAASPTTTRVSASTTVNSHLVGTSASKTRTTDPGAKSKADNTSKRPEHATRDRKLRAAGGIGSILTDAVFEEPDSEPDHPGDGTDPTDPTETTDPPEQTDPADPADPEPTTPADPDPTDPADPDPSDPTAPPETTDPTDPVDPEPTTVPTQDGLCPIIDPETGQVLDATTGEPVLDPETEQPLTIEDLVRFVDADGVTCAVEETPPTTGD